MKSKKLKLLEAILRKMARAILKKHQPTVIGITGSLGKTSTKEAAYLVLSKKFRVRKNEKNYNNEVGIPLTIIGALSGEGSLWKWIGVFGKWFWVFFFQKDYPEIVILELGVDHPGDMEYLTDFLQPKIGVVTNISSSHLEFFGSLDKIAKEKGVLVEKIPAGGSVLLNIDDEKVANMQKRSKAGNLISFGFSQKAQLQADRVVYNYDDNQRPDGISFKLNHEGKNIPVRLKHILAPHQVYAALVAMGLGTIFKINVLESAVSLEDFFSPPGRLNLLSGIKNTFLIDDTYNASPTSTLAALEVLQNLAAPRKMAVLGDMLELGQESEAGHQKVVEKISDMGVDIFIAVGKRMETAVKKVLGENFDREKVWIFADPMVAGLKAQELMKQGDLVLIKGSQGMRMEKVTEEIMGEPEKVENLLCRQSREWRKRPFTRP